MRVPTHHRVLTTLAVAALSPLLTLSPAGAVERPRELTVQSSGGYHGTVRLTLTTCSFAESGSRSQATFRAAGRSWQVVSTKADPVPGAVTVRATELGAPGELVTVVGECEQGEPECAPAQGTCTGTALWSQNRNWRVPVPGYLAPGGSLGPGGSVSTGPGGVRLTLTAGGNLVQQGADGRVLWRSGTAGTNPRLQANADGDVVLYAGTGSSRRAVWSTGTRGNPGARLVLRTGGGLAVYSRDGRLLWRQDPLREVGGPARDVLPAAGSLEPGQSLRSPDGRTRLVMQRDGNLVAYHRGDRVLWHSRTAGNPWSRLVIQNGNLTILSPLDTVLWQTGTAGGRSLRVHNDGDVVLTSGQGRTLWNSGTVVWARTPKPGRVGGAS